MGRFDFLSCVRIYQDDIFSGTWVNFWNWWYMLGCEDIKVYLRILLSFDLWQIIFFLFRWNLDGLLVYLVFDGFDKNLLIQGFFTLRWFLVCAKFKGDFC